MQSDIERARLWRAGLFAAFVCMVQVVAGAVLYFETGVGIWFCLFGSAVALLLALDLWRQVRAEQSDKTRALNARRRLQSGSTTRGDDGLAGHLT